MYKWIFKNVSCSENHCTTDKTKTNADEKTQDI